MEDREILEELIENANIEDADMNDCFGGEHIEAISNILKENENLKQAIKINQDLYETKCNENTKLEKKYDDLLCDVHDLFIRKSLVKEKIEEWNKERHIAGEHLVVQVLQDLLGKEK